MKQLALGTLILLAGVAYLAAADDGSNVDHRQEYRFVIKAVGRGAVPIRGLITVDGKDRVIERETTPYEFRCEAGSVISGYFEVVDEGRRIRLKVIDPSYSRRKASLWVYGYDRVRFSWAQPGVGPRCADEGEGTCPDSIPSVSEFKKKLAALRKHGD